MRRPYIDNETIWSVFELFMQHMRTSRIEKPPNLAIGKIKDFSKYMPGEKKKIPSAQLSINV